MELLPKLKIIGCPAYRDEAENPFNGLMETHKNAGLPITVVHP